MRHWRRRLRFRPVRTPSKVFRMARKPRKRLPAREESGQDIGGAARRTLDSRWGVGGGSGRLREIETGHDDGCLNPFAAASTLTAGRDALATLDGDFPLGTEENVDARTELDQTDALAGGDGVATRFEKTMRRAIKPAICLKTTRTPSSPSTVTTFCSFWTLARLPRLATRNLPRW